MRKSLRLLLVWSPVVLFLVYVFNFQTAASHATQPDSGHVKDPVNNVSCSTSGCHNSFAPFNLSREIVTIGTTSGNQVPLTGFQYAGNTQYIINFTATGGSTRPGFEMAALTSGSANAGAFAVINAANTSLQTLSTIKYIDHKSAGTNSTWSFNWTSPASTTGTITFYTAVNRSNNNNGTSGDSIFHQQYAITAAPVAVTVSAGTDVTVCPNTSTQLQATASTTSGTTYAWSPATGLSCTTCANPTATPASSTTYTVTVTNGAQTASDAVVVNTYSTAAPTISSATTAVCPGNSLTLSSSGFSAYSWSNGGSTASTSITTGGTYTLTATDANGCSTTASKTIQQGQTPSTTISSTQPFLCGSGTTTLSAGSFTGYSWSNNATTATITVGQTGNYRVTVTNATGCTATATYNLTGYALPTAAVSANGPLSFCSGGSVALTANSGTGYIYKWSTGATTASINVSQGGAYKVTVYNPCDSTVSQTQTVVVNTVPVAQLSTAGSVLLCNGLTQTLHASPAGASYTWLKDGAVVSGQTRDSLVVNAAGNYAVVVTQNTCSDTSQPVAVSTAGSGNASVVIAATQTQLCANDVITLDAGTGFTTYSWLPGNTTAQSLQVSAAGTYIVQVTANNGQCASTGADTIIITQGALISTPTLVYNTAICTGDTITISTTPATYTSYSWSNGSTTATTTGVTGSYSVTVQQSGLCGTATATINATGTALPDAAFVANAAVLNADATGATYQWYLDGAAIDGAIAITYTATRTGSYTLQVTKNGCSSTSAPLQIVVSGIEDISGEASLIVYPNPVNDMVKIKCNVPMPLNMEINIQSLDGRITLPTELVELHTGENILERDLASLAAGIYVLHLKADGLSRNIKLVKQGK